MEAFDPSMYPHSAYVLGLSEAVGTSGGVAESFPPASGLTPVPCRVRLKETRTGMSGEQEIGTTTADVAFPVDPGVAKGWTIRRASDGLGLRALGRAKDRAQGFDFVVACEVIE